MWDRVGVVPMRCPWQGHEHSIKVCWFLTLDLLIYIRGLQNHEPTQKYVIGHQKLRTVVTYYRFCKRVHQGISLNRWTNKQLDPLTPSLSRTALTCFDRMWIDHDSARVVSE